MAGSQSSFDLLVRRFRNGNVRSRSELFVSDASQPAAFHHCHKMTVLPMVFLKEYLAIGKCRSHNTLSFTHCYI